VIAGLIRLVTGARARWLGCEPVARQRIYFANHASNLDLPVIWASLPDDLRATARPIAAEDYWRRGPIRRWLALRVFRAVLIARTGITAANNPLLAMEAALAEGGSLIIFPEGTRNQDEDEALKPFKAGLWHLARKHPEVELVPVHLENLNRILPKGELILVPLLAQVRFGAPIALGADEDKAAFLERARAAVAALAEADESAPAPSGAGS
jgi:1-acyl-sn-glycerol-3-phosphate acyltransferase